MFAQSLERYFICPGEKHAISRSVHLARLAAYYPACRECPFRTEQGPLQLGHATEPTSPENDHRRRSSDTPSTLAIHGSPLFQTEGVRGIWWNEITRAKAGAIASAFAALLWEAAPVAAPSPKQPKRPIPPTIVIGHDARSSAPDIVTGVAAALRLMGCQVIDVGLATRPRLWFAVNSLNAAGGMLVSGAGGPPSVTGIDFVTTGGVPLSRCSPARTVTATSARITLDSIAARWTSEIGRPTRDALPQRTFRVGVPYEAGLLKHFHALRPLSVVCGTPVRLIRESLAQLFASLPCRLSVMELPTRVRHLADPADPDVRSVGQEVLRQKADLGIVVDEDGQRVAFLDERGRMVELAAMARMLIGLVLSESPRGTVVVESAVADVARATSERHGARCVVVGDSQQELFEAMQAEQAILGVGWQQFWFRDAVPTCDGIITLSKALDLLSRSDRPFSEVAKVHADGD